MDRTLEEIIELKSINGYLRVNYLVEEFSLKEAIKIVEYRKEITNNQPCYILADISKLKHSSKEVKNYFANEGAENVRGSAFCLGAMSSSLLFNLFIFFTHPKVEIKAFDNCRKADVWLQALINKQVTSQQ